MGKRYGKLNENIKNFRLFRNITQSELAELVGKSKNVISNWERGDNSPDPDTIEKLCQILRVTPNQIFGWERSPEYEYYQRMFENEKRELEQLKMQRDESLKHADFLQNEIAKKKERIKNLSLVDREELEEKREERKDEGTESLA